MLARKSEFSCVIQEESRTINMSCNVRKSCYVFEYRITFIGAEKVGKSAIIHQFIKKQFLNEYTPTSEDHMTYVVKHKGNMCVCLFVDTAGSDDFPAMRKLSLAKGNVFVVVYSIDNAKSFTRAKHFVDEIKTVKGGQDVKIMFVGNKTDLETSRKVSYEDGQHYATKINKDNVAADFVEVTAKKQDSVADVLKKLLAMFNVPDMVEVPVLQERNILSKLRKPKKNKTSRKASLSSSLSLPVTKNDNFRGNEHLSDSELIDTEFNRYSHHACTEIPEKASIKNFRRRADSQPEVNSVRTSSPPLNSYFNFESKKQHRRGSFSPNSSRTDISTPTLLNHSGSLSRYHLKHPINYSSDMAKSSSEDSGVSDDSNSQGDLSPRLQIKGRSRTASSPTIRRTSLSEKMKGMFKRGKSVIDNET